MGGNAVHANPRPEPGRGACSGAGVAARLARSRLVLGWLYERSGTLTVPALVHGAYNVVVFVLLFIEWGIV